MHLKTAESKIKMLEMEIKKYFTQERVDMVLPTKV